MQTQRIMMPKGHQQLCLEGHNYLPDELGAFTVPLEHVPELVRVHGAVTAPNPEELLARAENLETRARAAEAQVAALKEEAQAVRKQAAAETERMKRIAEERAQADAKAKEADAGAGAGANGNGGKGGGKGK